MRVPIFAVWEMTQKCNLLCLHCGSRARHKAPNELTTEESLDLVRQLADAGFNGACLIGGEFFLKKDWEVIARAVADRGMTCAVLTGAWGVSRELILRIKAAGVSLVSLSIDGMESAHDRMRGRPGSWQACFRTIEMLQAEGYSPTAQSEVNRLTLPDMPALCDRLFEAGIRFWRMNFTTAMGNAGDNWWMLIQPAELPIVYPLLAKVYRHARSLGMRVHPYPNLYYYGPLAETFFGRYGPYASDSTGVTTIGIEADGTIKANPGFPTVDYAAGNIREKPLSEILADPLMTFNFSSEHDTEHLWGFCRSCDFAEACRGGDSWTAHALLGRRGNNPICHHRALELAKRGVRERFVRIAPGPGLPFDYPQFELVEEPIDSPWPESDEHHVTADRLPRIERPRRPRRQQSVKSDELGFSGIPPGSMA